MNKFPITVILVTTFILFILVIGILLFFQYINNRSIHYVALGNSLAQGYPYYQKNKKYGYADLIYKQLNSTVKFKDRIIYTNYGTSGYTSSDLLKQITDNKIAINISKADIITIDIGGNDILQAINQYNLNNYESIFNSIDKFGDNLVEIFTELKDKNPNAHIYMCDFFMPLSNNDKTIDYDKAKFMLSYINRIILNTSKPFNIKVIQLESIFKGHEYGTSDSWFYDPIHPNQYGYSMMAKPFVNAISKDFER